MGSVPGDNNRNSTVIEAYWPKRPLGFDCFWGIPVSTPRILTITEAYWSGIFGLLPLSIFEGFSALFRHTVDTTWRTIDMPQYVSYRSGLGILIQTEIENLAFYHELACISWKFLAEPRLRFQLRPLISGWEPHRILSYFLLNANYAYNGKK